MKKATRMILLICAILCVLLFVVTLVFSPYLWYVVKLEILPVLATPYLFTLAATVVSFLLFSFKNRFVKVISFHAGFITLLSSFLIMCLLYAKLGYSEPLMLASTPVILLLFAIVFYFCPVWIMYQTALITKGKPGAGKCVQLALATFFVFFILQLFHYFPTAGALQILVLIPVMLVPNLITNPIPLKNKLAYCISIGIGGISAIIGKTALAYFMEKHSVTFPLLTKYLELIEPGSPSFGLLFLALYNDESWYIFPRLVPFVFGILTCLSFLYLAHVIKEKKRSKEAAIDTSVSQEV